METYFRNRASISGQFVAGRRDFSFPVIYMWPQFDFNVQDTDVLLCNIEVRIVKAGWAPIQCQEGTQDFLRLMVVRDVRNPAAARINLAMFSPTESDLKPLRDGDIITAINARFLKHRDYGLQFQVTGGNREWLVRRDW